MCGSPWLTAHHAIIRKVFVWVCVCLCVCWGGGRGGGLLIPCCEVPFCITPAVFNAQEEKKFSRNTRWRKEPVFFFNWVLKIVSSECFSSSDFQLKFNKRVCFEILTHWEQQRNVCKGQDMMPNRVGLKKSLTVRDSRSQGLSDIS